MQQGTKREQIMQQLDQAFEQRREGFEAFAADITTDRHNQLFCYLLSTVGLQLFREDPPAPQWKRDAEEENYIAREACCLQGTSAERRPQNGHKGQKNTTAPATIQRLTENAESDDLGGRDQGQHWQGADDGGTQPLWAAGPGGHRNEEARL